MDEFSFVTDCVSSKGEDIQAMTDRSVTVTRRTFREHCRDSLKLLETQLGYAEHARQGLTMAEDWHVSYHRSRYRGQLCYYLVWSAIEYVFLLTAESAHGKERS